MGILQISQNNLHEQIATVAKCFWSEPSAAMDRVIPCSSKMGLSAALLRRHPAHKLPKFDSIWNPNPDDIKYPVSISGSLLRRFRGLWVQCVTSILGDENPSATYSVFNAQSWRVAVERQWTKSGLPDALRRLTSDLVAQAKQRVLVEEGMQFQKQIRKIIVNQQ